MTTSVLIPTYKRGPKLRTCLLSLDAQTHRPDEVIAVWQGDDLPSRELLEHCREQVKYPLRILHLTEPGIVPAENLALAAATGEIIAMIDDDAIAPTDWLAKHVAFYERDPRCGAVGGTYYNFHDGVAQPRRTNEPIGIILWYGKHVGNMYDHIDEWRTRPPRQVMQLVGNNMSLRRRAFDRFEDGLRRYWQMFEMDACLQVAARGYTVWFDFSNTIEHHPTSDAYKHGRSGDLQVRVVNSAFNEAFVLGKFSPWYLRPPRLGFMLLIGQTNGPGIAACLRAMVKFGNPALELRLLFGTWKARLDGWRAGTRRRATMKVNSA